MTAEHHQLLTELLDRVLALPPPERPAFLHTACGPDEPLRREVESLIASFESAPSFIEHPVAPPPSTPEPEPTAQRIGAYRLLHELGHGGMGTVYLAERADGEFRGQVAVKLVRRGMDTEFVLRRFLHERQTLAALHHPNIAALLDGGTTDDGRPYFVMEYIEGEPLDVYCDRRQLPVNQRLQLFRTVCAAVHYAHQHLVIHRDLKPANLLVTTDGTVKLLDFGIAKILNPDISATLEQTATGVRLMTPEYAAPEQVRGGLITTGSDVYALGVVLYELLTGHRPYRLASWLPRDIEQAICDTDPLKPSTAIDRREEIPTSGGEVKVITPESVGAARAEAPRKLRKHLSGDLDTIVLTALQKEPQRRYASVEHFAEDVRRYLEGLPVTARRDTLGYRTGKFIRRNRAAAAAALLILLSLLGGLTATAWQARRARQQQARAERRFNDVRKLANSYLFEFHDAIVNLPGTTQARALVAQRALEYLDSLAREAGDDPTLQRELAAAYLKVGDVQGRPGHASLGDRAGALQSYRKALAVYEALPGKDAAAQRELATVRLRLGDALQFSDSPAALNAYRQALEAAEAAAAQREIATARQRLGQMLARTGKPAEAMPQLRQALQMLTEIAAQTDKSDLNRWRETQRDLFITAIKYGDLLFAGDDVQSALPHYERALTISAAIAASDATNVRFQRELAAAHDKVGNARNALGDRAAALAAYRAALQLREPLARADAANAEIQRDVSISHDKLGGVLAATGDVTGALAAYRQALAIDTKLARANPADTQTKLDCANSHSKLGELYGQAGRLNEARDQYQQAFALREEVYKLDPANTDAQRDLADSCLLLGELQVKLAGGSRAAALSNIERGRELLLDLQRQGVSQENDRRALDKAAQLAAQLRARR